MHLTSQRQSYFKLLQQSSVENQTTHSIITWLPNPETFSVQRTFGTLIVVHRNKVHLDQGWVCVYHWEIDSCKHLKCYSHEYGWVLPKTILKWNKFNLNKGWRTLRKKERSQHNKGPRTRIFPKPTITIPFCWISYPGLLDCFASGGQPECTSHFTEPF